LLAEPTVPTCSLVPAAKLRLGPAEGTATPHRTCLAHAGGGNILVVQPSDDTIATSMTGVVVARSDPLHDGLAEYTFDLTQDFEVVCSDPARPVKLFLEARAVGLLRNPKCCSCPCGSAAISIPARASIHCGPKEILSLNLPSRSAACGEELSVYNREGPLCIPVVSGKYTLHEVFGIRATNSRWCVLGKGPSAEFAPEKALDTAWINKHEPFHGAIKKSFGFQVIVKVVPENSPNPLEEMKAVSPPEATLPLPKSR
jgi:hypothetical protein